MKRLLPLALTAALAGSAWAAAPATTAPATTNTPAPAAAAPKAAAPVMATPALDPAAQLVTSITQGQAKISQEFDATDNLKGFVIEPTQGPGQSMIVYADPKGQYLFIGNLIGADGTNYTQQYTQQYIQVKVAAEAYQTISQTHWFVDGSDAAPHKLYVIIDPNCIFCHMLFKELQPLIANNELQVRWIAAGFLKPTSAGKAAQLLYAKTDQERIALLTKDETAFNVKQEEGGLTPLAPNAKDAAITAAFAQVEANTKFFESYPFVGTPVLLYKQPDGKPAYYPGYVRPDQLQHLLQSVGNQW